MTTRWFLDLALAAVCAGCAHPPSQTDPAKDNPETSSALKPVSFEAAGAKSAASAPVPVGTWVKEDGESSRIELELTDTHLHVRMHMKDLRGAESDCAYEGDCTSPADGLIRGTITRIEVGEHVAVPVGSHPAFEMRFARTGMKLAVTSFSFQGTFGDNATALCGNYYQSK